MYTSSLMTNPNLQKNQSFILRNSLSHEAHHIPKIFLFLKNNIFSLLKKWIFCIILH